MCAIVRSFGQLTPYICRLFWLRNYGRTPQTRCILDIPVTPAKITKMNAPVSITIASPLKSWVQRQAEQQGFENIGGYLNDLIRREKKRAAAKAKLEADLVNSIESGSIALTSKTWDRIVANGLKKAVSRRRKSKR